MSELPWAPEAEAAEAEAESQTEPQAENPAGEPGTLSLSQDDFSSLEDRILRAVNLVKRERLARSAAEERASQTEARLNEQETKFNEQVSANEHLQKELASLRAERDHIRQRVEKLLTQLDALEL